MKKIFIMLSLLLASIVGTLHAEMYSKVLTPFYQNMTLNALTIYMPGASTTTAAYFSISGSSISFKTAGGLKPGNTGYYLNDARLSTVEKLISFLNNISTFSVAGTEGGIVATHVQGSYMQDLSSSLNDTSFTYVRTSTSTATLTKGSTKGISVIFSQRDLDPEEQYSISAAYMNITFATGLGYFDIYNSSTTTTPISHETFQYTGLDAYSDISKIGEFEGAKNTPLRFDVYGSTNITAGYINIQGRRK